MDERTNAVNSYEHQFVCSALVDKQLSLIESLMLRKCNEFSDISQAHFRAERKKKLTEVINKSSSLLGEVTPAQSSM